ncbi:putative ribosome-binding factor A, mitochondrial [Chanos chanos]|uniref:Ribosome-binding factor A, mitochondrial n=1 Tax=Chanos chanos TaxID=29144 RepID=A0A6J2W321_CHACN|nr:putative ribosome-binding factor A, mitochondrial [Chanos chanos]
MFQMNTSYLFQKCRFLNRHFTNGMMPVLNKLTPVTLLSNRDVNIWSTPLSCLWKMNLHTSTCHWATNKLMKMFANKKRKKWYETPQRGLPPSPIDALKPQKKRNHEDNARVRVLNSILHKAVADMLSSHEVNSEIPAYGVEISRVSLCPDFSACRIYWKTSWSAERDNQIQQALDKCGPRIRYLLISQQILGSLPPVTFIRDKQYAAVTEVENLLKRADFGPQEDAKNESLNEDRGEMLHSVDSPKTKKTVLFGVDHDALHKQIEEYKQRSKDTLTQTTTAGLTQQQLDALAEIRKQKIIEKKKRKSKKLKDDDITPKAFLLARSNQKEEQDDNRGNEYSLEDMQIKELMTEDNQRY